VDLDAYFARIGFSGARHPTLETLGAIHLAHAQSIAFENLNPLMNRAVPLDMPSLEAKLVRGGRGGYCFEQNALLCTALRELGFEASGLAARVVWNAPPDATRPRTHMLLRVRIGAEDYIADVGFGALTLTAPLRLVTDIEQSTPHETFRLMDLGGGDLKLEAWVGEGWKTLYRFDLQPAYAPDYDLANYYVATHPASHFRSTLMGGRPFPGGRYALQNNQLSVHRLGAPSEKRTLTSVAEVREVLETLFGLTLPAAAEIDPVLARACGFGG
jgi:N-hydroxyarylamine O-acetyltransferase